MALPDEERRAVFQVDVEQDEATGEKTIRLGRHSYTAKLADADTFAAYPYAEGLRRGLDQVETLSSVNDGAVWIERITETNFPQAIQIVDWYHAKRRLHQVAQALWGEDQRSQQWLDQRLSELRQGKVNQLHRRLAALPLEHKGEAVRSAPGYFQHNQMRMRYDRFRRQNLPISSGSVESAVLHVVQHRMHRPGRGWNRSHAAGMLALLSEYIPTACAILGAMSSLSNFPTILIIYPYLLTNRTNRDRIYINSNCSRTD